MKSLFRIKWHGLLSEKRWKRLSSMAVILVALGMIQVVYAQNSDLAGYWPLDEGAGQVASDFSGNGNDGSLGHWQRDGVLPPRIAGYSNSALHFNEYDNFVEVADSTTLEPATTITTEAWVRWASDGTPRQYRYILSKGANACEAASYALYTGPNGGLIFYVSPDGTAANAAYSPDAGPGVWDGEWHHVVGTYDGSDVRLYVDYQEIGSGIPASFSIGYDLPFTDNFYIGAYGYGAGDLGIFCTLGFPGDIDEVKVWTRALSPGNQPPTADAGGPYSGDEGSAIALSGAIASDEDGDDLTYSWTVDSDLCTFDAATALNPNLTCSDNGSFTVTLEVDDGQGATANDTAEVTVSNVAPSVSIDSISPTLLAVGESVTANGSFTDPGTNDTHTAKWDWGDGDDGSDTVDPATNSMPSVSHVYNATGVYTVKLTVIDDDDGQGEDVYQFVVVYDPSAGFVTGGGWIDSPAGAYSPDPSLTGKATFGLVAKYKKGQNTPDGNTQFQFKTGNLNFRSSSYQWLVVAGPHAKFKGDGTINGGGNYGFMLTATDGQINGGGGTDGFRIKIWDKDAGDGVVYDNKMGASDDSNDTTEIGGGSIVVHNKK